ncbi:MAG: hypothetical protein HY053_01870 [Proteobacteria bacterium]|nr:hypothetical protein [Pseudomonadota bacterium]
MKNRLALNSGIAIGMILFVIALLGVIAIAISASSGNFMGTTIVPDRVAHDMKSQANLIRNKILECYTYGYDRGELADKYPSSTGNGTAVDSLDCPAYTSGQQNLWTGQSPAAFPPPPAGFGPWYYVNAGANGGRCVRIQPNTPSDVGIKNGLAQVSVAFSANELVYDSSSSSQRFILWITRPNGSASADCGS